MILFKKYSIQNYKKVLIGIYQQLFLKMIIYVVQFYIDNNSIYA